MFNEGYGHVGRPTNEEVNNKKKRKTIFVILSIIIVFTISLCGYLLIFSENFDFSSLMGNSAATGDFKIIVDGKKTNVINLAYGSKKQLSVDNSIAKQGVTWSSKKFDVVSVNKNGLIVANNKKVGITEVYATTKNGKKGIITIKVYPSGNYTTDLKNVSKELTYTKDYHNYRTNVRLYRGSAVMQSFAIDGNNIYYSQQQASNDGGFISRVNANSVYNYTNVDGQYLGGTFAVLKNYGHVANIDIEITNGKKYLWTGCTAPESTASHCRVPLDNINFNSSKAGQSPKGTIKFEGASLVAVDSQNRIIVVMDGSKKTHKFKVYNLDEYINSKGKCTPIYSFKKVHENSNYSRQGIDVDGNYIYSLEGNPSYSANNKAYVSVFKLDGTNVIYRKLIKYPTTNYDWEPEGIKIYNSNLYFGFAKINKSTGKKNQYIFKIGNV